MTSLAELIRETKVARRELAIFSLAQAGFCFKNAEGTVVAVDPYLSDACNRLFGFRRMIPPVISPDELDADVIASTHAHADHLDPDALPIFARKPRTHFVGAPDCEAAYREAGLPANRCSILRAGDEVTLNGIRFTGLIADHGDLAPDAIGLLMDFDGITIYNAGDSAFAPDRIIPSLRGPVDVMIAPINGAFGNMNADEACALAALVRPRILVASHFWMFIEHGGDPARFLEAARDLPQGIVPVVMAPGERLVYTRDS
jgi:L-ascorbate 6-phosphate lactonase